MVTYRARLKKNSDRKVPFNLNDSSKYFVTLLSSSFRSSNAVPNRNLCLFLVVIKVVFHCFMDNVLWYDVCSVSAYAPCYLNSWAVDRVQVFPITLPCNNFVLRKKCKRLYWKMPIEEVLIFFPCFSLSPAFYSGYRQFFFDDDLGR